MLPWPKFIASPIQEGLGAWNCVLRRRTLDMRVLEAQIPVSVVSELPDKERRSRVEVGGKDEAVDGQPCSATYQTS